MVRLAWLWFLAGSGGSTGGPFGVFCNAQNSSPFFQTAKFDPTAMHRTDMCGRHNQLYLDKITLPDALRGLNLSVVLTNYTDPFDRNFFGISPETSQIDDVNVPLFAVILDEIAERAGFTWRNTFGVVTPINSETDGDRTWSDLLRWEVETYDIAMGKWDRTAPRVADEILFPQGWYDSSVILVQAEHPEDKSLNLWSFLLPFQPAVWVTILATGVVSGLVYFGIERLDHTSDRRRLESSPIGALYYTFISFVGHNEFLPQTHPARLLAFSVALFALIVLAVYTANLASFLVSQREPAGIITSVQEAVLLGAPICLQKAVSLDQFITERYPTEVLVHKATKRQVFDAVVKGKECLVALVPVSSYETYRRNSAVNPDCTLNWQGRVERYIHAGMASKLDSGMFCTSVVNAVLDYYLLKMEADGFLDRVWEQFLQIVGDQPNCVEPVSVGARGAIDTPSDEETYSMSIQEMAGVFIVHGLLSLSAVVLALVQYWLRERKAEGKNGEAERTGPDQYETGDEDDELAIKEEDDEDEEELRQLKGQLEEQERRVRAIRDSLGKQLNDEDNEDG